MSWPTRLALPQPPMTLQAVLFGLPSVVRTIGRPLAAGGRCGVGAPYQSTATLNAPWIACHIVL